MFISKICIFHHKIDGKFSRQRCLDPVPVFKNSWIQIRFVLRGWIRIRFVYQKSDPNFTDKSGTGSVFWRYPTTICKKFKMFYYLGSRQQQCRMCVYIMFRITSFFKTKNKKGLSNAHNGDYFSCSDHSIDLTFHL